MCTNTAIEWKPYSKILDTHESSFRVNPTRDKITNFHFNIASHILPAILGKWDKNNVLNIGTSKHNCTLSGTIYLFCWQSLWLKWYSLFLSHCMGRGVNNMALTWRRYSKIFRMYNKRRVFIEGMAPSEESRRMWSQIHRHPWTEFTSRWDSLSHR